MARATTTAKQNQESPADNSFPITPTDDVEVGVYLPRAIYVGIGGDISMMLEGDDEPRLFASVPTGSILPVKARVIMSTGTSASAILGLF